jgi:N6-L-threonylcarbamoyladenine synthase
MTDVKAAISAYEEVAAAVDTLVDALQERDRIRNEPESVLTLGIETSCDETAVSVLAGAHDIRSNIISTSAEMHRKFGGVVPEIASRAQVQSINPAIQEALVAADTTLWDLSSIAVTIGPGLVGSLIVGVAAAKALASALDLPLVGVNHLESHLYANFLEHPDASFPAMGLIVSGGHTMLVHMVDHGLYEVVGQTLDDAAGEAFDKVARLLGLGFPGGPAIDAAASKGDPRAVAFPRSLLGDGSDFSFSGVKTSVSRAARSGEIASMEVADVAASFQEAICEVLVTKTMEAALEADVPAVFLCGGVAANSRLRSLLEETCVQRGLKLYVPSPVLCTDNAAMVAACGFHRYQRGVRTSLDVEPDPNLTL